MRKIKHGWAQTVLFNGNLYKSIRPSGTRGCDVVVCQCDPRTKHALFVPVGRLPSSTLWPTRVCPNLLKPWPRWANGCTKSHASHLSVTRPQTRHSSSHVDRSRLGTPLSFFFLPLRRLCTHVAGLCALARSLAHTAPSSRTRPTPRVDHTFVPPCGCIAPQFPSTGI